MKCHIRIARDQYEEVIRHLFPGDNDEHGLVLLASMSLRHDAVVLLVREVHLAEEGADYIEGRIGYRALAPSFIHKMITRARDERLVYLAAHNHGSDRVVSFSRIDLQSHERGYPALLQIAKGMPVGGLVFGRSSVQADLWLTDGTRAELTEMVVVGSTISRFTPRPRTEDLLQNAAYDRQVRMFGRIGQDVLQRCCVGVIGLGGVGSLVVEYLARLGIGNFLLIDSDLVEHSNLSRIVGATTADADRHSPKTDVAKRMIVDANSDASVQLVADDVAKESVALQLRACDYIFLAADSMRARLVFNAIVHQYLIPGVQLGAKVRADSDGQLLDLMSANRPVRPGRGCLWCNQLIDPTQLAKEAKTDAERKAQAYGTEEPNPSVITLNAVSAAHAVNDFLLNYLGLRREPPTLSYEHFYFLKDRRSLVEPRRDAECSECSRAGQRYARGDLESLPCISG